MSNLTTDGANAILDGTAIPTTLYLQHHIGASGEDGNSNIATTTTRTSFTRTTAASRSCSNAADITVVAAATQTLTHWSAHSASSGGTCWFTGAYDEPLEIAIGLDITVPANGLVLTIPPWVG